MPRAWMLVPALLTVACEAPTTSPLVPQRVENPALMVAFSDIPEACEVSLNAGIDLELLCWVEEQEGRVTVVVSDPERLDLRQSARDQRERFEALPEGVFHGILELVTPTGPAYTARGSYLEAGEALEEVQVHVVHPSEGDRRLTLRYTYPEGDRDRSQVRRDQLLFLVGELEGLESETPADAESSVAPER